MGLGLVNMVGAAQVGNHSRKWLPLQPVMSVLEDCALFLDIFT